MFNFHTKNFKVNEHQINDVCIADNIFTRLKGLLFIPKENLTGMYLTNCNSVHTIGMRYNIDIIFLSQSNNVVKVETEAKPYKLFFGTNKTNHTLELNAGAINNLDIKLGQKIEIL